MPKAKPVADLDGYIDSNRRRVSEFTPEALEHFKHFAKRASEGRVITFDGMRKFFQDTHGITIGRMRLRTIAQQNGITAWWSA